MLEKEESPDPVLVEEAVGQEENEKQAVVGHSGSLQQQAGGRLEKEEGGSEQDQLRACFVFAEE